MPGDPRTGDLEHRRIDVEELDARARDAIEDRRTERAGARAEIDDVRRVERADDRDDGVDHRLVPGDVGADRRVVVARREPEVGRDTVLGGGHR